MLPALSEAWEAFCILSSERRIDTDHVPIPTGGMLPIQRPRPIGYAAREDYLDRRRLQGPRRWLADHLVQHLDRIWMEHQRGPVEDEEESEDGTDG